MKKIAYPLFLLAILVALFQACSQDEPNLKTEYLDLPDNTYDYGTGNNELATLGRVLFYDRQLSLNNTISCASCHKQTLAFADNVAFSIGFENKLTHRNSMPIQNLHGSNSFFGTALFWDGREQILESMVMKPIVNHVEMGITSLEELTEKLEAVPYYEELFTKAYGSSEITNERIAGALTNFLVSITSNQTTLDRVAMGQSSFTALETEGQNLFLETYDCNACHQVQNPNGYVQAGTFANIGLDEDYSDDGLAEFTRQATDAGKFKIPSLRNVALTAPYMHDGRFQTLDEVIGHYSEGIADHENLDFRLRQPDGKPMVLNISQHEKLALIAFLNTLTDYNMISDPRFSNPFKTK